MLIAKKLTLPVFIVAPLILFALGCSTLPRDKGKSEITRKMLVTAYDPGQKSTGWKYKYGCCLLPPVYAYGPQEGKRKKVGITSSGVAWAGTKTMARSTGPSTALTDGKAGRPSIVS